MMPTMTLTSMLTRRSVLHNQSLDQPTLRVLCSARAVLHYKQCEQMTSLGEFGRDGCKWISFLVSLCWEVCLMKRVGGWEWTEHSGRIERVYLTHPPTHPPIHVSYEYTPSPPTFPTIFPTFFPTFFPTPRDSFRPFAPRRASNIVSTWCQIHGPSEKSIVFNRNLKGKLTFRVPAVVSDPGPVR